MSKFKNTMHSARGHWVDVRTSKPCPVCGSDSWCQVSENGEAVLCKRVSSNHQKLNKDGIEFFVHRRGANSTTYERPHPTVSRRDRASVADCDVGYSTACNALVLSDTHRESLLRRGLTNEQIALAGYVSMPVSGRSQLAKKVIHAVGETAAMGIPGIHLAGDDDRSWVTFGGAAGTIIPVRDLDSRIVGLVVRADDTTVCGKYTAVSSAKYDGPSAASVAHVPVFESNRKDVFVTEGPLKADVITALSGTLTLGLPGVAWRTALPILEVLKPARVVLCFDGDHRTNPHVARALRACFEGLRTQFNTVVRTWDARFKGYDDLLAARKRGEVAA